MNHIHIQIQSCLAQRIKTTTRDIFYESVVFVLTGQIMDVGFLRCVDIFHDINLLQGQYL